MQARNQFVIPLIYAFIGLFLYVPWLEIEPAALVYQVDAPTNGPTQLGPNILFLDVVIEHVEIGWCRHRMQEWSEIKVVLEPGDQEGIAGPWEAVWVRRTHTSPPQLLCLLNRGYFLDATNLVSFNSDHVAEHKEDVSLCVCVCVEHENLVSLILSFEPGLILLAINITILSAKFNISILNTWACNIQKQT